MVAPPILDDPILAAFDRRVADGPDQVLVVEGRRRSTAAEIDRAARAVATRLISAGLAPGAPVALVLPNGAEFLAAFVGVLRAGHPALLIDAGAPQAAVERIVRRLGGAAWLRGGLEPVRADDEPAPSEGPGDGAVIKLTSGSSGDPRGVLTSTAALVADDRALRETMGIRPDDRLLGGVPFSHSYGLSSLVLPALVRGIPLVVPHGRGPFAALDAAREGRATVFPTAPAYVAALLRLAETPALPASLRLVLAAGAPLRAPVARGFRERFGRAVHVFYGASECGGITYDRSGDAAERGSVGEPVAGVSVTLEVAKGAGEAGAGRIVVESPALAQRYVPDPDPRLGDGRFTTDDLGRWSNGELVLAGRLGSVINLRGRKVSPAEIERTILSMPGVDDVCVVPVVRDDPEAPRLRAVVASRRDGLTAADVIAWCRERLSDFKVPRSVLLVSRLPVDERGKIDRGRLIRSIEPEPSS